MHVYQNVMFDVNTGTQHIVISVYHHMLLLSYSDLSYTLFCVNIHQFYVKEQI